MRIVKGAQHIVTYLLRAAAVGIGCSFVSDTGLAQQNDGRASDGYIGMAYRIDHDQNQVVVLSVQPSSPAEQAGLQAGDILKEIDGAGLEAGVRSTELLDLLSGPAGTEVRFGIERTGVEGLLKLVVRRASKPGFVGSLPTDSQRLALRSELEAMLRSDQLHRREALRLEQEHGAQSAEAKTLWAKQLELDQINLRRLKEIVAEHGWPAESELGPDAAAAAFFVLQHAPVADQREYLPLLRKAAEEGELPRRRLALLEDRILVREGKKQIYGTQLRRNAQGQFEPHPVEDEAQLDARRADVGLPPIAEYLLRFGLNDARVE